MHKRVDNDLTNGILRVLGFVCTMASRDNDARLGVSTNERHRVSPSGISAPRSAYCRGTPPPLRRDQSNSLPSSNGSDAQIGVCLLGMADSVIMPARVGHAISLGSDKAQHLLHTTMSYMGPLLRGLRDEEGHKIESSISCVETDEVDTSSRAPLLNRLIS